MKRITLLDYGMGNLHSLAKAATIPGAELRIETDPVRALDTDILLLPGVGAFGAAAERIAPARGALREALQAGLPCLGICLGMQLLMDASDEGPGAGIGLIPGRVRRLQANRLPQIGWNIIEDAADPALASSTLTSVYYANGFVVEPDDPACVTAWSTHESDRFPAMVRTGRTLGVQFHPEKSSQAGVDFLRGWLEAQEDR
ncbi:MAG: imidazole glycerol phosphate synthase subunit HisH [Gemmatimonadales bacterium]